MLQHPADPQDAVTQNRVPMLKCMGFGRHWEPKGQGSELMC